MLRRGAWYSGMSGVVWELTRHVFKSFKDHFLSKTYINFISSAQTKIKILLILFLILCGSNFTSLLIKYLKTTACRDLLYLLFQEEPFFNRLEAQRVHAVTANKVSMPTSAFKSHPSHQVIKNKIQKKNQEKKRCEPAS